MLFPWAFLIIVVVPVGSSVCSLEHFSFCFDCFLSFIRSLYSILYFFFFIFFISFLSLCCFSWTSMCYCDRTIFFRFVFHPFQQSFRCAQMNSYSFLVFHVYVFHFLLESDRFATIPFSFFRFSCFASYKHLNLKHSFNSWFLLFTYLQCFSHFFLIRFIVRARCFSFLCLSKKKELELVTNSHRRKRNDERKTNICRSFGCCCCFSAVINCWTLFKSNLMHIFLTFFFDRCLFEQAKMLAQNL